MNSDGGDSTIGEGQGAGLHPDAPVPSPTALPAPPAGVAGWAPPPPGAHQSVDDTRFGSSAVEASPTRTPGLVIGVAGLIVAASGFLNWFELNGLGESYSVTGFQGKSGSEGWIGGIPGGWLTLVAGLLLAAIGFAVASGSAQGSTTRAGSAALVVAALTLVLVFAERSHLHGLINDAINDSVAASPLSASYASSIHLSDGVGLWLTFAGVLVAGAAGGWLLTIEANQRKQSQ